MIVIILLRPRRGMKYCDRCVCLSVSSHNSKTARRNFTKFLCMLPMALARSSYDGVVIRYVLPALWMTSCHVLLWNRWARVYSKTCSLERFARWRYQLDVMQLQYLVEFIRMRRRGHSLLFTIDLFCFYSTRSWIDLCPWRSFSYCKPLQVRYCVFMARRAVPLHLQSFLYCSLHCEDSFVVDISKFASDKKWGAQKLESLKL